MIADGEDVGKFLTCLRTEYRSLGISIVISSASDFIRVPPILSGTVLCRKGPVVGKLVCYLFFISP